MSFKSKFSLEGIRLACYNCKHYFSNHAVNSASMTGLQFQILNEDFKMVCISFSNDFPKIKVNVPSKNPYRSHFVRYTQSAPKKIGTRTRQHCYTLTAVPIKGIIAFCGNILNCRLIFCVICVAFVIYHLIRFLHLLESCDPPNLHHLGTRFTSGVLRRCPSLTEIYEPPAIWGKCGHFQTALYGKIGRWSVPSPLGKRFSKLLSTGETITYDVFEPSADHTSECDYTILVCPGIANSSEDNYVKTFIDYATSLGFRVAVLNHLGSLASVGLTSPKIFTYGDTKYFGLMIDAVMKVYTRSTFLMVGYSMGANIMMKYLGEDVGRQNTILCAVSLCQGYDGLRSAEALKTGYRLLYNKLMVANFKKILKPHWEVLFVDNYQQSMDKSKCYDEVKIETAKCMYDIEDGLLRRFDGHASVHEYIDKASCSHVMHNVKIPVLLVNSADDPVVTNDIHDIPESLTKSNPRAIFSRYQYGGHLGFYTGHWYRPDGITLIEKMIVEYFNAVIDMHTQPDLKL